jgi:hypothetical protein
LIRGSLSEFGIKKCDSNVMYRSRELPLKEIAYYVNRKGARRAILFYLGLSLAFLLFHLFVSAHTGEDMGLSSASEAIASVIGIAGAIVSSVLGIIFLRRLCSREPYLVISVDGIYDNASGMNSGAGQIAWSEIAAIRLTRYHGLPCVELVPKDREQFLQRFSWMERLNRSSRLGYPAVAIRGPLLPVEPDVLVEQMREYRQCALDT